MTQRLAMISLLVKDYDDAISFYTEKLNFQLIEDKDLGDNKRWVEVKPAGNDGASLLLAEAGNTKQGTQIGKQGGDRVFLFLHTDNFDRDYRNMTAAGVKFLEEPRIESYGKVAVFKDLYGNRWDLLEPTPDK